MLTEHTAKSASMPGAIVPRTSLTLLLVLMLILLTPGCMSILSRVDHGFRLYSGIRADAQGWYQPGSNLLWRLFLIADLPFSLVADTALLPVDLYVALTELTPEERWEKFGEEQARAWNALPLERRKQVFEKASSSRAELEREPLMNGIHVDPETHIAISLVQWERRSSPDKR